MQTEAAIRLNCACLRAMHVKSDLFFMAINMGAHLHLCRRSIVFGERLICECATIVRRISVLLTRNRASPLPIEPFRANTKQFQLPLGWSMRFWSMYSILSPSCQFASLMLLNNFHTMFFIQVIQFYSCNPLYRPGNSALCA